MVYSFARIGAALGIAVEDVFTQNQHCVGEHAGAAADRVEQQPLRITAQAGAVEVGSEKYSSKLWWQGMACRLPPFSRGRTQSRR
jgi:hypothetical protein